MVLVGTVEWAASNMKPILYETEMLTNVYKGIYTITTYYVDGTVEVREVPKGSMIIPQVIYGH